MKTHNNIFNTIFSLENLFDSWKQFRKRKTQRLDVQKFEVNLEKNIFQLYENLNSGKYKHGTYYGFYIFDPKQRHIHKASVRDRIVHQAIYAFLTNIFEKSFIHHSYSSRLEKGSHKGMKALEIMIRKMSKNYTGVCYALKCDIRRFFDTLDHEIITKLIKEKVQDESFLKVIKEILSGFDGYKTYLEKGK